MASRRKNATRESTATLKQWLNEHKKNPYPTKGEKIMLAIITKMTLTQVSYVTAFVSSLVIALHYTEDFFSFVLLFGKNIKNSFLAKPISQLIDL